MLVFLVCLPRRRMSPVVLRMDWGLWSTVQRTVAATVVSAGSMVESTAAAIAFIGSVNSIPAGRFRVYRSIVMAFAIWRAAPSGMAVKFDVSAMLLTFITGGKWLEATAKMKAGDAVATLLSMQPSTALLLENDVEREVDWALNKDYK